MTKSLLDKISHDSQNSYITDKWMNRKTGVIIDIIGDGCYRFIDYIIEGDVIRKRYISQKEELNCPIIATGIVGYWLHCRDNFAIKILFENYYSLKMSQYEKEHENDDDAWNRDLKKEFALRYHIPAEKKAIHSSEAIFEFLTEEDVKKIRNITKNYLQFIRFKRNTDKEDDTIQVLLEHHDNTDLDYYLSKKHWNYRVNSLLYKFLLIFYEGHEVADFLNPSRDRILESNPDYGKIYGIFFNETYIICKDIITDEVPETKLSTYLKKVSTWKFRSLKDIHFVPNAIDCIEGYHILCMSFSILSLLEVKTESIKKFIDHLCIFDNEVYYMYEHQFKDYCINYQILVFGLLHERKDLGNSYDYDNVNEAMKHDFVWYAKLFEDYERQYQKRNTDEIKNNFFTPVYISYNWRSSELIAEQLCGALDKAEVKYAIDKENCPYRKNIREFENHLGNADMIITVINDEYLKSIQCMRELALISKKGMMDERLFPIVDLDNREVTVFTKYRKYWIDELKKYETLDKSPGNDAPILEVKQDINLIINKFSDIWEYIKNVNSPSWEILSQNGCKLIIDKIQERINQKR